MEWLHVAGVGADPLERQQAALAAAETDHAKRLTAAVGAVQVVIRDFFHLPNLGRSRRESSHWGSLWRTDRASTVLAIGR